MTRTPPQIVRLRVSLVICLVTSQDACYLAIVLLDALRQSFCASMNVFLGVIYCIVDFLAFLQCFQGVVEIEDYVFVRSQGFEVNRSLLDGVVLRVYFIVDANGGNYEFHGSYDNYALATVDCEAFPFRGSGQRVYAEDCHGCVISLKVILDLECVFATPFAVGLVLNQNRTDDDRFMFESDDEVGGIRSAQRLCLFNTASLQ